MDYSDFSQPLQNEIDISYDSQEFMLPNKNNFTPLHYACKNGIIENVETLVKNENIDINAIDDIGSTPLYYAVKRQDEAIAKLLVDHGADPLLRNAEGTSILSLAKSKEMISILRNAISNSEIFKKRKEITNKITNNLNEKSTNLNNLNSNDNDENIFFDDQIKLDFSSSDNEEENVFIRKDQQALAPDYDEFQEEEEEEEYMECDTDQFLEFKQKIESKIYQMQASMSSQISEMVEMIKVILQKRNNLMQNEKDKKISAK